MAQNTVTVAINADVLPFLKSQHEALAALAIAYESAADHILRRIQAIEGRQKSDQPLRDWERELLEGGGA